MVERTRLLDELLGDGANRWIVEAASGFGKTTLLNQLAASHDRPVLQLLAPLLEHPRGLGHELAEASKRSGLDSLAAEFENAEGAAAFARILGRANAVVSVDAVEVWDLLQRRLLEDLVDALSPDVGVIVAGRFVDSTLRRKIQGRFALDLHTSDLAFTADETLCALAGEGIDALELGSMLQQVYAGWPEATAKIIRQMSTADDPLRVLRSTATIAPDIHSLMGPALESLEANDRSAANSLSILPSFDIKTSANLADDDLIQRMAGAGLPLDRDEAGWYRFFEPARQLLRASASVDEVDRAANLVRYLWDSGHLNRALRLCLSLGDRAQAAERLASIDHSQLPTLDLDLVDSVISTIGESAGVAPRCLYVQSLLHARSGSGPTSRSAVESACSWFERSDPDLNDSGHLESLMLRANWLAFAGDADGATQCAEQCGALIDGDKPSDLLGHLRDLEGLVALVRGSAAELEIARTKLLDALAVWRSLRRPAFAVATTFRLTSSVLGGLGRRREAIRLLKELPLVGDLSPRHRALLALEEALALPWIGAASEVQNRTIEVRRLAAVLGHAGIAREAALADVVAAGVLRDPVLLRRVAGELEQSDAAETVALVGFGMCEIAAAYARCGLRAEAERALSIARSVPEVPSWQIEYAAGALAARLGDEADAAGAAEHLSALVDSPEIAPGYRWHIALLIALAHRRSGNQGQADRWRARSDNFCAELGEPDLGTYLEASVIETLDRVEPADPVPVGYRIELFDNFRITLDGQELAVPPGQVSTVVKLIVLAEGRLLVDQVIDVLWPDATLELGRRRLRNVLQRLRIACGELVRRQGDALTLAAEAQSDLLEARRAGEVGVSPNALPVDVDRALAATSGDLLPDDRYEEWAEDARRQLQRQIAGLWDKRASIDERAGDIDAAIAALRKAERAEPGRWDRSRHAVDLLLQAGRRGDAAALRAGWD